jgi:LCP family protein required for cell wall assembly
VTSLERDILVDLIDEDGKKFGQDAKLNAAYANGGAAMAIKTIEALLDIPIDYYMQINMQGLVDLVDAVGGITVTNDFDYPIKIYDWEPEYTATVEPGTHKVNGEQALVYSRMRYDDPEGDYGRQRRQRIVIGKIIDKLLALDSISNYRRILQAVSSNMQTDIEITSSTIPSLLNYRDAFQTIENNQLYGEDAEINGGSYQIVTAKHLLEIQNKIKKELGLETKTTLKTNAILYEALYGGDTLADDEDTDDDDDKSTKTGVEVSDTPSASSTGTSSSEANNSGSNWLDTLVNDLGGQNQIVENPVEQPATSEVYTPQTNTEQIIYTDPQAAQTVTETYEVPVEQPVIIEQPATGDNQ